MDDVRSSTAGQGLGVAGFVIGLIALILAIIPCLGVFALAPGILALLFSIIAYSQASRANTSRGLIISALIISILATSIASWQHVMLRKARDFGTEFRESMDEGFGDEIRQKIQEALEGLPQEEEMPDDTLTFDTDEMIKELERLEKEKKDS
jgi:hypothetical protein